MQGVMFFNSNILSPTRNEDGTVMRLDPADRLDYLSKELERQK